MALAALLAAALASGPAASTTKKARPNLLFLHDESTDGRTYQRDMGHLVPIPNIRKLQERGVNFVNFYCNVPICAVSTRRSRSRSAAAAALPPHPL